MIRRITPWIVSSMLFFLLVTMYFMQSYTKDEPVTPKKNTATVSKSTKNKKTVEKATEAGSQNPDIEKYILRYDESGNKVVLITLYTDKSRIISHIKSIKPQLLTQDDIGRLKEGIELFSREEMYILIEDYSS